MQDDDGDGQRIPAVEALIARMTLEEKVGQMSQRAYFAHDREEALEAVRAGRVGSFLNVPDPATRNELQRLAVEQSRLGIPLVFGRDVIHGYRTIFPIVLGQAASFDPELVEAAAAVAASEAAAVGIDWTFAPMIDVSRDPRWGRIAESPGEDPHLTAVMGAAMVRGFQGSDPAAPDRIAACAKHYVGYGAAEAGKDYNTTYIPDGLLHETYLPPYRACVEAGVLSVMTAFNDLNGVPATGNEPLVRGVLKGEWGFRGVVVSDWASMTEMINHGYCADLRAVAQTALRAGVDLEMATHAYRDCLPALAEDGTADTARVDDAVRRVLELKHRLGLFARPYTTDYAPQEPTSRALKVAKELALRSLVLLTNDDGALPLSADVESIAVVGPLADDPNEQLGCWAFDGIRDRTVTVVQALRERVGDRTTIQYVPGLTSPLDTSRAGFVEAVAAATAADVTIVVLGETADLSGECHSRAFLDFPGAQVELLERLAATGRPIVLVVFAGRPLVLGRVLEHANAVVYAWHPGTMGGPAIVDVLFGDESPSGRLPVTFPRAVGQIPIYHAFKNTGRPPTTGFRGIPAGTPLDPEGFETSYLDLEVSPEFPFGFGMSYATIKYSELVLEPSHAPVGHPIQVHVTVENTGTRVVDEVVQVYLRDLVGSVTRPVRELKAFRRVRVEPGQRRRIQIELDATAFEFVGLDLKRVTEPGRFHVFVGGDSTADLCAELELV